MLLLNDSFIINWLQLTFSFWTPNWRQGKWQQTQCPFLRVYCRWWRAPLPLSYAHESEECLLCTHHRRSYNQKYLMWESYNCTSRECMQAWKIKPPTCAVKSYIRYLYKFDKKNLKYLPILSRLTLLRSASTTLACKHWILKTDNQVVMLIQVSNFLLPETLRLLFTVFVNKHACCERK